MAKQVYNLTNTNPDAADQLDSTLAQVRERVRTSGAPWRSETVKSEDGSLKFTLEVGAKPAPSQPPEVQG